MRTLLVTQRLVRSTEYEEERDALDVRWPLFLREAGLLPIPVPSSIDLEPFLLSVGDVAGLLLTGGNDIGAVTNDPLSLRRDSVESSLCGAMEMRGKPILGVCRGLQLLAHLSGAVVEPVEGHTGTRHRLHIAAGSRWLASHDGREVNSFHGFGFRASSWHVAACAADGTVEALEHPERRILGIMWHPERERPFAGKDVELFREFFR